MNEKINPAKGIVVCEAIEDQTANLLIPDEKDGKKSGKSKVVAIGEGTPPIKIKKGDTIIYRCYSESLADVGGEEYNFIDFKDIVAKIE